ncbi:MAG: T9SS type A sorting domain-containing protein [Bacteroidetes bacterium]|nr:T9SS type A sorting domain-containing protein [Bacteroidota bacterium]
MKTDSSFNVQWQKHFTTYSVFNNMDMTPVGLNLVPGGGVMILVKSAANCCSKIMVTDSLGNIFAYHEYALAAGFNNPFFYDLYALSNGSFLTGGHLSSNTLTELYPCSVELNAAGDLVRFIVYQSDSSFGSFDASATAYKEGEGLYLCGDQATGIGKNKIVVYDTDSLLELDCLDSTASITKVEYSAHDSIFNFNLLPVIRTNINFTNSINISTPNLIEEFKCVPVGLSESPKIENMFEIFPNPAKSEMVVRLNDFFDWNSVVIRMFALSGKLVLEKLIWKEETIVDVSNLPSGFYYLQVNSAIGMSAKKVVLMR